MSIFLLNAFVRRVNRRMCIPHVEILSLNKARADVSCVRVAGDFNFLAANALGGAVSSVLSASVQLLKHRVIDLALKRRVHGTKVDAQLVRRELNAVAEPRPNVVHERSGRRGIACSNRSRYAQLRVRINGRPRPDIASVRVSVEDCQLFLNGLLLRVAERPNLIALHAFGREITNGRIVECFAGASKVAQQLFDSHARNARDARRCAKAVAFHQTGNDARAVGSAQAIHIRQYTCSCKYCRGRPSRCASLPRHAVNAQRMVNRCADSSRHGTPYPVEADRANGCR